MKSFKEYLNEEMMPFAQTEKGFVGVDNGPVRDNINIHLASITAKPYATPYHAMEMVRKVLAPFSIFPPHMNFLDGDSGHEVFEINQFGDKMGMTNDGQVVVKNADPYFVYFEYAMNDRGGFDIFCEIVTEDELSEIMSDIEAEMEDGDTTDGDMKDAEDSFDEYKSDNQIKEDKDPCWDTHKMVGMKMKGGRKVPNCVPVEEEQIDEVDMSKKVYINAMKSTTGYDAGDDEGRIDTDKLIARAKKYKGEKFAKQLAGADQMTSRPNRNVVSGQWGSDQLAWRKPTRKTKSGKANKQDTDTRKREMTPGDYRKPKFKKRNLPEANEPFDPPFVQKGKEKVNPDRRASTISKKAMMKVIKAKRKEK